MIPFERSEEGKSFERMEPLLETDFVGSSFSCTNAKVWSVLS